MNYSGFQYLGIISLLFHFVFFYDPHNIAVNKTTMETQVFTSQLGKLSMEDHTTNPICTLICPPPITINCGESKHPNFTGYPMLSECSCGSTPEFNYEDSFEENECGTGIITRTWTASNCNDIYDNCIQTITVMNGHNYEIYFPADLLIDSMTLIPDQIQVSGSPCDLLAVSVSDQIFSSTGDEVYKILRTYKVINWCEYNGVDEPIIVGRDEDCDNQFGDEPIYVLRRPDGTTYLDANREENDNIPASGDICGIQSPGGHWKNSMIQSNENPLGDPSITSVGFWQYTQVIQVFAAAPEPCTVDTINLTGIIPSGLYHAQDQVQNMGEASIPFNGVINLKSGKSVTLNPDFNIEQGGLFSVEFESCGNAPILMAEDDQLFCSYNNTTCEGQVDFIFKLIEGCNADNLNFNIFYNPFAQGNTLIPVDGSQLTGTCPNFVISGDYPIGRHQFVIAASNNIGVDTIRIFFYVRDCKPPTPICINGLAVELLPVTPPRDVDNDGDLDVGAMLVFASDFIAAPIIDCSGPVIYSINRSGESPEISQDRLYLTCDDESTVLIEIHAWDLSGNQDFCETYILVQTCGDAPILMAEDDQLFCSYNNTTCDGQVDFNFKLIEGCNADNLNFNIFYDQFGLDNNLIPVENSQLTGTCPNFKISGNYPIGTHRFIITVSNNIGVDTIRTLFSVRDCKQPTPICINGLAVELMPVTPPQDVDNDGDLDVAAMLIFASDFVASPIMDCSGPIVYSINRIGDSPEISQDRLYLTCDDDSTVLIELHAWDSTGNQDYCETYILVQKNMVSCNP